MGNNTTPSQPAPKRVPRGILYRDGPYVKLTDLDTAGYLHLKNLPLQGATRVDRYKSEFVFYDPSGLAEELAIAFINSECADYADSVHRIKKVIHRFHGRKADGEKRKDGNRDGNGNGNINSYKNKQHRASHRSYPERP